MLKAVATGDGGKRVVLVGIEPGNIERLKAGKPLRITLDEIGLADAEVVVMYTETVEKLALDLQQRGLITPETRINPPTP